MQNWKLLLAFIGILHAPFVLKAEILPSQEVVLESSKVNKALTKNESIYVFTFKHIYDNATTRKIHYSIDGKDRTVQLEAGVRLHVKTTPGNHIFQFYYSSNYHEVYTDSLHIDAQHEARWTVNLRYAEYLQVAEKPIIYLYPKVATEVQMTLDIKGNNPFLYPAYNNEWKFTAHPNGDLTFGENTYNYLFWEASNVESFREEERRTGFVVAGEGSTKFLEEKLTEAGLTSKEQADFITYWAPRMMKHEQNLVHFIFNEDCERYASLNISPKPDNLYRIYMVWTEIEEGYEVTPQKIKAINREGFTVLEWGGQESTLQSAVSQLRN